MTATLKRFAESRLIKWLLDARRLPLYFAVTVVTAIMYHYFAAMTPVWAILSFFAELLLFKLFRFVEKHHFLGGICFCAAGFVTLALALTMIVIGENPSMTNNLFVPDNNMNDIDFYIWFLTPQSVLNAVYLPYTIAIFLLFTFFIGFVTYYFTIVRYRILMSFAILCFPFAIYAKEAEVMPVLCIILLFACYFAVMIFCRQLHNENPEIVQQYSHDDVLTCTAQPVSTQTLLYNPRPEISDRSGWRTGALFLAGACIIVLMLPKPTVHEDRSYIEGLINMAAFTDALLNAISGFESESDGGTAFPGASAQTLYYANADIPANLRRATFARYHYDTDSWEAAYMDEENKAERNVYPTFRTALTEFSEYRKQIPTSAHPTTVYDIYLLLREVSERHPDFAEKWGFSGIADTALSPEDYLHTITMHAAAFNSNIYIAPNQTYTVATAHPIQQNLTGIIYRKAPSRVYREEFTSFYLSDAIAQEAAVQYMMADKNFEDWLTMLSEMIFSCKDLSEDARDTLEDVFSGSAAADAAYEFSAIHSETPDRVLQLAEELTSGCSSDYEKASAICDYLAHGDYIYDLEYVKAEDENVETFLFESKTGVCYEFATAMVELCRAAGIPARYVEGYAMSERSRSNRYDFVITTKHGHAFADVYIAGYGWMSMDATAPDFNAAAPASAKNIIRTLQLAGLILLVVSLLLILMLTIILPYFRERAFCRWYESRRDGAAVEKAFARLRKEWDADPAVTARCLCEEMEQQLQCDTAPMRNGLEQAVYGTECSPETADAAFRCYLALREAWKKQKHKKA